MIKKTVTKIVIIWLKFRISKMLEMLKMLKIKKAKKL